MTRFHLILILLMSCTEIDAKIIHVPRNKQTIQGAINTATAGDTILVSPGRYAESIALKPGIVLRSVGNSQKGETGLLRAESTILDCGERRQVTVGVIMAEGCTLDGFTITNVGKYDQKLWEQHHATQGEQLTDQQGAVHDGNTRAAISVNNINCTLTHNIVHHNGYVGIAIMGDKQKPTIPRIAHNICYRNLGGGIGVAGHGMPVIHNNICYENLRAGIGCRNASPLVIGNTCYRNIRAGIGCREAARPVIRGNRCYQNRRAGIGIRMRGTSPIVENNECYQNDMAGIGSRDKSSPTIRNNKCYQNTLAGIGCNGSLPMLLGNDIRANERAGIGLRGDTKAFIQGNTCRENKLVAIGVTEQAKATIIDNQLIRTGGMPPLIVVTAGARATLLKNKLSGGGVAALLVQGTVSVSDNEFFVKGKKPANAIWVRKDAQVRITGNVFSGYRTAVNAATADVKICNNQIRNFNSTAIVVTDSLKPAHIFGNHASSTDPDSVLVRIKGQRGIVENNILKLELPEKK